MERIAAPSYSTVVLSSTLAIAVEPMLPTAAEDDPDADFAEHTSERPDISFGRDYYVAAVINTVSSEALRRACNSIRCAKRRGIASSYHMFSCRNYL